MKIIDGLKLSGRPAEIPDTYRTDLPAFFKEMGYKKGAEIGVYRAEFTELFCKQGLEMIAVDTWPENEKHYSSDRSGEAPGNVYEEVKAKLAPYNVTMIRKTSVEAAKDIEDGSLDFVYLDADHTFRAIAEDLFEWSKKVRKGGAIAGHDYYLSGRAKHDFGVHVKPVVDAFTETFRIKKWYVLGERWSDKRDRWRSYFWINE